jgi:hypothetical protein
MGFDFSQVPLGPVKQHDSPPKQMYHNYQSAQVRLVNFGSEEVTENWVTDVINVE